MIGTTVMIINHQAECSKYLGQMEPTGVEKDTKLEGSRS